MEGGGEGKYSSYFSERQISVLEDVIEYSRRQ